MKAIETQLNIQKLEEKSGEDEDEAIEAALNMISVRRKLIAEAIKQQREISSERQILAQEAFNTRQRMQNERKIALLELQKSKREKAKLRIENKRRELKAALDGQRQAVNKAKLVR